MSDESQKAKDLRAKAAKNQKKVSTDASIAFRCLSKIIHIKGESTEPHEERSPNQIGVDEFRNRYNAFFDDRERTISDSNIRKWVAEGLKPEAEIQPQRQKMNDLTIFLRREFSVQWSHSASEFDYEIINRDKTEGEMVYQMAQAFSFNSGGYDYGKLRSFEGEYVCYRRAWASGFADHIQRSIVKIKFTDYWQMSEIQKTAYGGHKIDETNKGPILPFGSNMYAIIKSKTVLKMIGISSFYPEPGLGIPIELFHGFGQGISGKGPHPGYPFVCSRVGDDQTYAASQNFADFIADENTRSMSEEDWRDAAKFQRSQKPDAATCQDYIPEDAIEDPHAEQCIRILLKMEGQEFQKYPSIRL